MVHKNIPNSDNNIKTTFEKVYAENRWPKGGGSGPGSEAEYTCLVRPWLIDIIKRYSVQTFVDTSCGAMVWQRLMLERTVDVQFIGIDVAETLIDKLNQEFKGCNNINFLAMNSASNTCVFPPSDLIMTRHTMMHLSMHDAKQLLSNLIHSGARYLIASTHEHLVNNPTSDTGVPLVDSATGGYVWRPMNLMLPPFNLGEPDEKVDDSGGSFENKGLALGMWKL